MIDKIALLSRMISEIKNGILMMDEYKAVKDVLRELLGREPSNEEMSKLGY